MKKQKKNIVLAFCVIFTLTGLSCEMPKIQEVPGKSRFIGTSELEEVISLDDFLASASDHKKEKFYRKNNL